MTVIVEDQAMFREHMISRVKAVCGSSSQEEVMAFSSYEEADASVDWKRVSTLIVDIHLTGRSGLELSEHYRSENPRGGLMFISGDLREYVLWKALSLSPQGFLNKEESGIEDFDRAYSVVRAGGVYLCKSVRTFASELRKSVFENILSPREIEIFSIIAKGKDDRETAQLLSLSEATVTTHRRNIMRKLGVHSSTELLVEASRLGLRDSH